MYGFPPYKSITTYVTGNSTTSIYQKYSVDYDSSNPNNETSNPCAGFPTTPLTYKFSIEKTRVGNVNAYGENTIELSIASNNVKCPFLYSAPGLTSPLGLTPSGNVSTCGCGSGAKFGGQVDSYDFVYSSSNSCTKQKSGPDANSSCAQATENNYVCPDIVFPDYDGSLAPPYSNAEAYPLGTIVGSEYVAADYSGDITYDNVVRATGLVPFKHYVVYGCVRPEFTQNGNLSEYFENDNQAFVSGDGIITWWKSEYNTAIFWLVDPDTVLNQFNITFSSSKSISDTTSDLTETLISSYTSNVDISVTMNFNK